MLGLAVYHFHMSPNDFWQLTAQEYWAIMRCANPKIDEELNTDVPVGAKFTAADRERMAEMMKRYG